MTIVDHCSTICIDENWDGHALSRPNRGLERSSLQACTLPYIPRGTLRNSGDIFTLRTVPVPTDGGAIAIHVLRLSDTSAQRSQAFIEKKLPLCAHNNQIIINPRIVIRSIEWIDATSADVERCHWAIN